MQPAFKTKQQKILIILTHKMYQILSNHPQAKPEDSQTASISSGHSISNGNNLLARELYNNVVKQLKKNETKLNAITAEDPTLQFQLYRPKLVSVGLRQNFNGELLEKQLDRLMEDECKLDKQLSKISFKHQHTEQLKEIEISHGIDHLSILRTVWSKSSVTFKADQKIDEIGCRVATVRNHIKMMSAKENNMDSTELQKYVLQSKQYQELKQKYEEMVEKIQDQETQYRNKIESLQKQMEKLALARNEAQRKANEQCQKNKKRDQQLCRLMQKCQYLELQALRKEKQVKKSSKQNAVDKLTPQIDGKKMKFTNKIEGFTLQVLSTKIELDSNHFTLRTLSEVKDYMTTTNVLENLVEAKVFNIPLCFQKINNGLMEKLDTRRPSSKRKNTIERKQQPRSQTVLGSQDKRKRFERTKLLEQFQ